MKQFHGFTRIEASRSQPGIVRLATNTLRVSFTVDKEITFGSVLEGRLAGPFSRRQLRDQTDAASSAEQW